MLAGLERELGIRLAISVKGARSADWEALKMMSRMTLWHAILSPLPLQPTTNLAAGATGTGLIHDDAL